MKQVSIFLGLTPSRLFQHFSSKMPAFLYLLSALTFLAGLLFFFGAKTAIHEIEGLLVLLMTAVFLSGAAICSAIDRISKK